MKNLNGKTALITGAANGVGRALAFLLAERGMNLILVDIDQASLAQTSQELSGFPVSIRPEICDLADTNQIIRFCDSLDTSEVPLHLLVNNAAVSVEGPLDEHSQEDIDWIESINLRAPISMCRGLVPRIKASGGGQIVNVASAAGLMGLPNITVYSATKAGLAGFSEALRAELYREKIGVSCAFPGPIASQMLSRSRIFDPDRKARLAAYLAREGDSPEEVAHQILKGILRNKPKILISRHTRLAWQMRRLMPIWFGELLARYQHLLPVS